MFFFIFFMSCTLRYCRFNCSYRVLIIFYMWCFFGNLFICKYGLETCIIKNESTNFINNSSFWTNVMPFAFNAFSSIILNYTFKICNRLITSICFNFTLSNLLKCCFRFAVVIKISSNGSNKIIIKCRNYIF